MVKAFVVGFPKSGTTTLHRALTRSGFRGAHWMIGDGIVGQILTRDFNRGNDPMVSMPGVDVVTQADYIGHKMSFWPQMNPALLQSIEQHHPECTFILNYRDPAALLDSMWRWADLALRLERFGAPGLPIGAASDQRRVMDWFERHFDFCRRFFQNSRFVEYDIEDERAPDIISEALGVELAWWGRANANRAA